MSELIDVRGMNVNEYCSFVESRALHLGVSPVDLNIECVEKGLIDWDMYERAKWELHTRGINGYVVNYWTEDV